MAKIAHAQLPKVTKSTRQSLDADTLKEALDDLNGSFDFAPHAYTDAKAYKTHREASAVAQLTIRSVAEAMRTPSNMLRRRIWEDGGEKDRDKPGKWRFAVSQRSTPPKPRAPRKAKTTATT